MNSLIDFEDEYDNVSVESVESLESLEEFNPRSLIGHGKINQEELERQRRDLKAKEKKIRGRIEMNRVKQEAQLVQRRQAMERSVSERMVYYDSAAVESRKSNTKFNVASELLTASDDLFKEINQVTDPSIISLSSKDDDTFVSRLDAIKARKEREKQQERDAFLAAKKKKQDRLRKKKERLSLGKIAEEKVTVAVTRGKESKQKVSNKVTESKQDDDDDDDTDFPVPMVSECLIRSNTQVPGPPIHVHGSSGDGGVVSQNDSKKKKEGKTRDKKERGKSLGNLDKDLDFFDWSLFKDQNERTVQRRGRMKHCKTWS